MKLRQILIYLCFFVSGAAGLIYEVVWSRQLSLFLGITSHANTAVITAYMLGLAAGSWWLGRWSDRLKQPLRAYAWLEIGVGLYAATTPWLFSALQAGYAEWAGEMGVAGNAAHLARFGIALAALLVPTFLMGGTLPLLVRGVLQASPQLGAVTGRLYGINSLGATVGTATTGFLLLPRLGVNLSIGTGVAANLAVALLILAFVPGKARQEAPAPRKSRKPATTRAGAKPVSAAASPAPHSAPPSPTAPGTASGADAGGTTLTGFQSRVLLAGFATAGFAALLTQMAWIRAMVLVVGGNVYAFTIALTSFLAGIGLGSLVYSRWLTLLHDPAGRLLLATMLAFLTGLTSLLSLTLIARLPLWFLLGFEAGWVQDFAVYQVFIFALCFAVMIVPTLLMGALFPLLAVTWTGNSAGTGRGIGTAYAVNTIGTVLGALLGGLVALPWLGIHYSIVLAASLYCLVAAGFWWAGGRRRPLGAGLATLAFAASVWLTPAWNREQMANGVFYHPEEKVSSMRSVGLDDTFRRGDLLYYREGSDGTVAVSGNRYQKSLVINGKVDATSVNDLSTQIALGQIGALMHPDPRNALVIGLGSGITAGALATHRSLEDITVLEISPEVAEAATFFASDNNRVLDDRRLNLVSADARNFVLASDRQWDLIISEPSNPWISGISNLFTEDFFRLARQKLAPGGIMTQWFHLYSLSAEDVRTVLKGFSDTYRHVTVWHLQAGDLIMTGSDQPHTLDMRRLRSAFADPLTGPELRRAGFSSPRGFLRHYLFADSAVRAYAAGARPNTDERPRIEFNAPRSMYAGSATTNLQHIVQSIDGQRFRLPVSGQFTLTPDGLQSHTANLSIKANGPDDFSGLASQWWLWRMLATGGDENKPGMSDLRELSWSGKVGDIVLQVVEDTYAPDPEQRSNYLAANMGLPVVSYGGLQRDSDPGAQWLLGATPDLARVVLGLFWTCPTPEGNLNWYIVSYAVPDAADEVPATLADSFSRRFSCL